MNKVAVIAIAGIAFIFVFCALAVFVSVWFVIPALALGFTPAVIVFRDDYREARSV